MTPPRIAPAFVGPQSSRPPITITRNSGTRSQDPRFHRTRRVFRRPEYVMAHSLAHALMSEVALDCGYPASALKERLYVLRRSSGQLTDGKHADVGEARLGRRPHTHIRSTGRLCRNSSSLDVQPKGRGAMARRPRARQDMPRSCWEPPVPFPTRFANSPRSISDHQSALQISKRQMSIMGHRAGAKYNPDHERVGGSDGRKRCKNRTAERPPSG